MIVAFSTSSAWASVSVMTDDGRIVSEAREAPRASSGACLDMLHALLDEVGAGVDEVDEWIADVGPGSFIGVRVAVMLAKTLAMVHDKRVRGVSSFDLIAPDQTVAFPSRKGEWFVRQVGQPATRVEELPADAVGFGPGLESPIYPLAERVYAVLDRLPLMPPEALHPDHLMEPAISQPKVPYRRADA